MAEITDVYTFLPTGAIINSLTPQTVLPTPVVFTYDPDSGAATLTGTVTNIGGIPVRRRVQLIEERSGRVIREVWSDAATGVYVFSEIRPQVKYTVVSYDHTGLFRAVIADNLEATT